MPPDLIGPSALLVAALIAVGALWREHLKADADDRSQRDEAINIARESVTAVNRLAAAQEAANKRAATQRREGDK